jgi:putative DNA primase/helicase
VIKNDSPEGSRLPEQANVLTSKYKLTSELINPSVATGQEGLNMGLPYTKTNPEELLKFHTRLMKYAPRGYNPFYFVLEIGGKEPKQGISWKNNRKTITKALYWMRRGHNIAICATDKDPLCIVDVDDLSQVPEIKPTLQATSRKRIGRHNYFFAIDGTAKRNIPTKDAGEVRSVWQYVLAPGSYVPCSEEEINRMPDCEKPYAGRYTLNNELPINTITFEELPEVYIARYAEMKKLEVDATIRELKREKYTGKNIGGKKSALWDLDITDVSGVSDTRGRYIPMPSVIHGSETGHNCKVSNGLMHCWRHSVCHNAFSYLCMLAGIASCERAGRPHGGRFFGVNAQDGETVFKVWMYAKEHGMIPQDDPIPRSALVYYAVDRGCCKKSEIQEGNRLPILGYSLALLVAKQEGINLGRN